MLEEDSTAYAKSSGCRKGIDVLLHAVVDGEVGNFNAAQVHRIEGNLSWKRQGSLLSFAFFFGNTAEWFRGIDSGT